MRVLGDSAAGRAPSARVDLTPAPLAVGGSKRQRERSARRTLCSFNLGRWLRARGTSPFRVQPPRQRAASRPARLPRRPREHHPARPARSWFTVHLSVQGMISRSQRWLGGATSTAEPFRDGRDADGAQFAALDLVNTVWRGAAGVRGRRRGAREVAVGDVGHEAGADVVVEPDPPGRGRPGLLAWKQTVAQPARPARSWFTVHLSRSGSEQSVQGGGGNVDGEPFAAAAGDVDGVRVRRVGPYATRSGGRSRARGRRRRARDSRRGCRARSGRGSSSVSRIRQGADGRGLFAGQQAVAQPAADGEHRDAELGRRPGRWSRVCESGSGGGAAGMPARWRAARTRAAVNGSPVPVRRPWRARIAAIWWSG